MAILTNKEILLLAKSDPTYKSITSKLTDEIFTDQGYEEIAVNEGFNFISNFFQLSIRVVLQKIKTPNPRIPKLYDAIVENYDEEKGGIFQRIGTEPLKAISPKFKKLVNGGSVDPYLIRKPITKERFYKQNFDFQNLLTIQRLELKNIFLSDYGINNYVDGIIKSLNDSYYIQKYEIMTELLSKALLNEDLKPTQKIEVDEINQNATETQMIRFLQAINSFYSLFETTVMSSDFNVLDFEHGLYNDEYYLLVRGDVMSNIRYNLNRVSYNLDDLGIKFKTIEVKNFGGIKYQDLNGVDLLPVYDENGSQIGFNATGEGEPLEKNEIVEVDPLAKTQAVLIQKGAIFTTKQQPFEIETIYNPSGKYFNLWASEANGSFNLDNTYDIIKFDAV